MEPEFKLKFNPPSLSCKRRDSRKVFLITVLGLFLMGIQSSYSSYAFRRQASADVKVTGAAFGTSPWTSCTTCTFDKAFDNNTSTYFDANDANGAYAGIDAGSAKTVTRIRFYPRQGNTSRMVGGKFQGSNTSSSAGFVDLYSLSVEPTLAWQEVNVNATTGYRYLRYLAPNGGHGNVAEVEFYATNGTTTDLRNPENPANTVAGLEYKYYEGTWSTLPNFDGLTAAKTGNVTSFDMSVRTRNDNFGFKFTGFINVATDGTYTFYTSSDDGSKLYIGTTEVVSNDGLHGTQERSGAIGLKAGKHAITVTFFEAGGGEALTVSHSGPSLSKTVIPVSALFRTGTTTSTLTKVTGTIFGSAASSWFPGRDAGKAFDGDIATFFDAESADGAYTGIDAGTARVITRIRFYPRSDQVGRMTGGKFQGSNTSNSAGFVDLYTIPSQPTVAWQQVDIPNTTGYRYLRYLAPNGAYGNVAEVEFYYGSTTTDPTTYNLVVNSGSGDGSYTSGTVVNITADAPPSGKVFDQWTGNVTNVANRFASSTQITMPSASTTVSATYKDQPVVNVPNDKIGANFWNIGWTGWQQFFKTGVNWNTVTNPWRDDFLGELSAYASALRFMDWSVTNFSDVRTWNQRISKTANHYNDQNNLPEQINGTVSNSKGVAYEWQIDLCNRVDANFWLNVPHLANDEYITNLANLIKNNLDPGLKVYIEYSNEVWNAGFGQYWYAKQMEDNLDLPTTLNYNGKTIDDFGNGWSFYIYRSLQIFKIFEEVFGSTERLVKVIAGQVAFEPWPTYANPTNAPMADFHLAALLNPTINPNNITIDAYAIAPYWGGPGADDIDEKIVPWLNNNINSVEMFGRGVKLIAYEGGEDSNGEQNPAMYDVYIDALNKVMARLDGVFMQYTHDGGNWGLKQFTGQPISEAHKYRAVIDWLAANGGSQARVSFEAEAEDNGVDRISLFPNPVSNGILNINLPPTINRRKSVEVTIANSLNQTVSTPARVTKAGSSGTVSVNVSHLKAGVYFAKISQGQIRLVRKFIVK